MPNKVYITTPIYYVNARPHIGHAYTTIAADVLARRHRLLGEDVFFLTGTDEHGQKIERSAAAAGIPPQQFADEVAASFENLWNRMGILNDSFSKDDPLLHRDFIRTTSAEHKRGVQKLWRELESRGAIYLDSYTGAYCVSDETFVDLPAGTPCPDCGKPLEIVTEENYFFRLSQYQEKLIELIESGTLSVEPEARRNEVLSFVRGGLKDLSISRTSFKWGIPVPGNEKHVVYVWLDALTNYMSAVGYGSDAPEDVARFEKYWPADLHLVGKEIIRFHCVYWPAFLLAARLKMPKKIQAHGWLLFEESKMSKSRGNIVRTETILDAFGEHYRASIVAQNKKLAADPATANALLPEPDKRDCDLFAADVLRYFLLREIPFGQDGSFSFDALITRYNADLANGCGNLVSRTLAMIGQGQGSHRFPENSSEWDEKDRLDYAFANSPGVFQWNDSNLPPPDAQQFSYDTQYDVIEHSGHTRDLFARGIGEVGFNALLADANLTISITDKFLSREAPWKLAKDAAAQSQRRLAEVLYTAAESIRIITALLYPFMPHTTAKVWAQLGLGDIEAAARKGELKDLKWGGLKPGTKLGPLAPIFPRAPKELAQVMADMEAQNNPPKAEATSPSSAAVESTKYGDSSPTAQNDKGGESRPSDSGLKYGDSSPVRLGSASLRAQNDKPSGTEASPTISIDDFAKVDLRVARVLVAERIPKADKLLRLEVDLGPNFDPPTRQILAGIAQFYEPEKLVGRKVVVVANLAPRKMRGLESQGMVVAASVGPDGAPVLAGFLEDVEVGARLK